MRTPHISAVLFVLFSLACGQEEAPQADPRKSDFTSLKPGDNSTGTKSAAESTGATPAAGDSNAAPKIEDSDVVRVVGDRVLILNAWRGLQIVDAKDKKAPTLIQRVPMQGQPREMYVAGGYATVVLGNAFEFGLDSSKGGAVPFAGTQVRVVHLGGQNGAGSGSDAKEVAKVEVGGFAVASRRIDDRLIVVTADTQFWPWWGWCYGPWACAMEAGVMATGGVATKESSASSSGGASTGAAVATPDGASVAYPWGGWGYGATADSGAVAVIDQKDPAKSALIGTAKFDGGAGEASIEPGEVIVAGSQYKYDAKTQTSSRTDRVTQVLLDGNGKPKTGAVLATSYTGQETWNSQPRDMHRLANGLVAIAAWKGNWDGTKQTGTLSLRTLQVDANTWKELGKWSTAADGGWFGLAYAGNMALVSQGTWWAGDAKQEAASLKVVDLAKPEAPKLTSEVKLAGYVQPAMLTPLFDVAPALWLVAGMQEVQSGGAKPAPKGGDDEPAPDVSWTYKQVLTTLSLADLANPATLDKLELTDAWGYGAAGAEYVGKGTLLTGAGAASKPEDQTLRIVTLDGSGKLNKRGTYASKVPGWWKLKSLLWDKVLLRASNEALELVDVADLDKPAPLGSLELAANVVDVAAVGPRAVALVQDAMGGQAAVRVLAAGSSNEQTADGKVALAQGWARLYAHETMVYAADWQGIQAVDVADTKAPKLRGKWTFDQGNGKGGYESYDPSHLAQKGAVLYALSTNSQPVYGTAEQCKKLNQPDSSTPPSSGGSSPGSPGAEPQEDPDGSKPTDPVAPEPCILSYTNTSKLRAIDFANPDKPAVAATLEWKNGGWFASPPALTGNTLYATHFESGTGADGKWWGKYWLDRVDLSDPKKPKDLGNVNVPGGVFGLDAAGKVAYTLDWQPVKGGKPDDGKAESVLNVLALSGGKAYLESATVLPGHAAAAVLNGKHVYVGTWDYWWTLPKAEADKPAPQPKAALTVYDATDSKKVKQIGSIDTGAGVGRMELIDTALFLGVGYGGGLQVWHVGDANKPKFQTFLPAQGWVDHVVKADKVVYLATGMYGIGRHELK
jgi:hypothetical protein